MIERRVSLHPFVYTKTYLPGDTVPNFTLKPGSDLDYITDLEHVRTVDTPTKLSDLLKPNMGKCTWAACAPIVKKTDRVNDKGETIYQQLPSKNAFWRGTPFPDKDQNLRG